MDLNDTYIKYDGKYTSRGDNYTIYRLSRKYEESDGGKVLNRLTKKIKIVEYKNSNIYYLNNIDDDVLDKFSEFPIGSITKIFTIIALLILHENKKININGNIGKYIDNDEIKDLKIIDIINHTSGLKNSWDGSTYGGSETNYDTATEVYEEWNNGKLLDIKSRGFFSYSNIGYVVLGVLIEKVTNTKYSDFVKNNILSPLKMKNTGIGKCNMILYNRQEKKLSEYEKRERTFASSAGELKSSINDLIKFSKFTSLLNANTLKIIKELYMFFETDNTYEVHHGGSITGGVSQLLMSYNKDWQIKKIYVTHETIKG